MLANTFSRVFRPVATPLNPERYREHERDSLAGLEARSRLGDRDVNRANGRDSDSSDLPLERARTSVESSDYTPLLTRKHSSQPSTSTATTVTITAGGDNLHAGPSHVFWKTPHPGTGTPSGSRRLSGDGDSPRSVSNSSMRLPTPTTPVHWESHPMGRSVSSPSLSLAPVSNTPLTREYRPSSLGVQSSRSLKLPRDSLSASDDSDVESEGSQRNGHHTLLKQLSPIHEQQVPFPPHRKLSMDSVPKTPDSIRTFDRITTHSASHSAFINRPLKRSLSQTSTSTHLSNLSSATPPVIPPLDLRPNFQSAVCVPPGPQSPVILQAPVPRKSRMPILTLPTVIGSPRQTNMVSVIYEDGASASARSSSYATPPSSPKTPPPGLDERQSLKELRDLFVDPEQLASDRSRGSATETVDTDATHRAHPAGLPDAPRLDGEPEGGDYTRPNSRTGLRPQNPVPPSTLSGTPRNSRGLFGSRSRSSDSSSFYENLEQRWLKGLSFGSARFAHPPPKGPARSQVTRAFVLFWLGFIAPWCWLIGGWLLSGERETVETAGPLLPLWQRRSKGKHVAVDGADGAVANGRSAHGESGYAPVSEKLAGTIDHKRIKATSWYPLLAPSVESLAPEAGRRSWAHRLRRRYGSSRDDPWIMRCRLAAAISGVLLFGGFVVAMIFVAGVHP
ncbi:hypothetical protein BD311DRAFT_869379 [Dichomitus squalens]|uniref:Uncharacterized protein n=1 Tax=Dichomitus squalens TaxID=114155 RepID=A0A4Q9M6C2_9APHY|nr:hypothetical protein BD311DRAFT_869379 [Dichomitus squalens]